MIADPNMFMDNLKLKSKNGRASGEGSQPITISIIYKDAGSRDEAARLCRRLAHNLRAEFRLCLKWWPFDSLGTARSARAASLATARADLVIVSTKAGHD